MVSPSTSPLSSSSVTLSSNPITLKSCCHVTWRCVLILSLFNLVLLSVFPSASAKAVSRNERWFSPCSGSRSVLLQAIETEGEEVISNVQLVDSFDKLAKKASALRHRVKETKNDFIKKRFRHESVVDDFDQAGFRIDGMPPTHSATAETIGHAEITSTVHQAFDDLARLAVFMDQARIGEALAINENHSFEEDFQRIEDHPEHGLYFLLCSLHQVIRGKGQSLSEDRYNGIVNLKIVEVDNSALRHTRDYLVLRDFEKILSRLSVHFESLKGLHASV